MKRLIKGESTGFRLDKRLIHKDGHIVWTDLSVSAKYSSSGNLEGVIGVARDISIQKSAEQALRESEEKYRNLIEQSNDAIYLLYNRNFEIINQKFREIFGVTTEDVKKPEFNLMDLVAPESKEAQEPTHSGLQC